LDSATAISVAVLLAQRAASSGAGTKAWVAIDLLDATVRREFAGDGVAARILNDLEADPDDERRIRSVAHLIQVGATHDPTFRAAVERLTYEALTASLWAD
jgi:hypothetical protein